MLIVVTYHYISESQFPHPGIHPLTPEEFRTQIEELGRHFQFIAEKDLLAALDGKRSLPNKACLLTFDDGLQEQYNHAVPVLEDLGVPAIFFIPGRPYVERRPLAVHRIHWLRSQTEPSAFQEMLFAGCEQLNITDRIAKAERGTEGKYFWDDVKTRKAKYLLNVLLAGDEKQQLLSLLEGQARIDPEAYFVNLYMTSGQVKELGRRFAVGTHGYSHEPLARMDLSEIKKDIRRGMEFLTPMCGTPASISYPYGYEGTISQKVFDAAQGCGLRIGFTTERSFNATLNAPLAFARVDTNDAPGGKRPIIFPNRGGFDLKGSMSPSRTTFLQEQDLTLNAPR